MKIEMCSLSNASIEEHKRQELKIDIDEKLEPASECCIYRVPKDLRKINEGAYTPQLIAIGPLHHGNEELVEMEKQKVRYKKDFGERIRAEQWEDLIAFIKDKEQQIRHCYAEASQLPSFEYITMILYDAIFIIELFLKKREGKYDLLPRLLSGLELDLQLLENQLPYFILDKVYSLVKFERENYPGVFIDLSREFFSDSFSNRKLSGQAPVQHFTDLRRHDLVQSLPKERGRPLSNLRCAAKLNESGVKFKDIKGGCLLNVVREKRNSKIPIPFLSGVELKIPQIEVDDNTETVIRNLMALEQCHYPFRTHICNYISFMDDLIKTEKDIDLLIEKGIILNGMGDNATIAQMFNRFGLNIHLSASCYSGIVKDLNAHYNNGWNRSRATLKRVYFSNPWKGTGTIAGIILLLLTFIQTICSIKQVFWS